MRPFHIATLIVFVLAAPVCEAASVIIPNWSSVAFDSDSGYHVEIGTDGSRHVAAIRIKHNGKEIHIPGKSFQGIVDPSLNNVEFLNYRTGAFGLEIYAYRFSDPKNRADIKHVWEFDFEGDAFTGVSERDEPVDANGR